MSPPNVRFGVYLTSEEIELAIGGLREIAPCMACPHGGACARGAVTCITNARWDAAAELAGRLDDARAAFQ